MRKRLALFAFLVLFTAPLYAQTNTQLITALEELIKNLQQSILNIQAILDQIKPVNATCSAYVVVEDPWIPDPCPVDGKQTRKVTQTRVELTPAKNGGTTCEPLEIEEIQTRTCEFIPPPPPPSTNRWDYYKALAARPDVHQSIVKVGDKFVATPASFQPTSQADVDAIPTSGSSTYRWPVIYDPNQTAMLTRTKGETESGQKMGLNAEQKVPRLGLAKRSMFMVYDYKIGPGAAYKGEGYLKQYKAYRLDTAQSPELWLSTKFVFTNRWNETTGIIAEMLTTGGWYAGPGVTYANSEILEPRVARWSPKVNIWNRYFLLVEGLLGGAAANKTVLVHVSIWAADENTEAVLLYDRLPMYAPVSDIRQFRFEFNTSETTSLNPLIEIWNGGWVVLSGDHLTRESVKDLLQKPVK